MSEDRMQGIPQGNILRDRRVQGREATIIAEQARALAESQAAELREEVERVSILADEHLRGSQMLEAVIEEQKTENATLREQLPQRNKWAMVCSRFGYPERETCAATIIDRITQAEAALERQQRAVTLLVPEFLEAMADIGEYGFEKYGDGSFQARRLKGDNSRGPLERCKSINVCLHGEDHFDAYIRGDKHDHFGTLEHQLAAAAFNAMMEFYFAGFASRSREQEPLGEQK